MEWYQFSLRSLFLWTLLVAVTCAIARPTANWLVKSYREYKEAERTRMAEAMGFLPYVGFVPNIAEPQGTGQPSSDGF